MERWAVCYVKYEGGAGMFSDVYFISEVQVLIKHNSLYTYTSPLINFISILKFITQDYFEPRFDCPIYDDALIKFSLFLIKKIVQLLYIDCEMSLLVEPCQLCY